MFDAHNIDTVWRGGEVSNRNCDAESVGKYNKIIFGLLHFNTSVSSHISVFYLISNLPTSGETLILRSQHQGLLAGYIPLNNVIEQLL